MVRRFAIGMFLLAFGLGAQDERTVPKMERYDFHPLMQQIWDAWGTLDPANVARFYSKDAQRTFFDIAPLKYTGWTEYAAGVKKTFADYSSAKFTLTGSTHVVQRPTLAWATATGHATLTKNSGGMDDMDFRWTVLWEKEGTDWLIIHEHISVPLAAPELAPIPAPPPPADAPQAAPKTVRIGQTREEVVASFGQPEKVVGLGAREIYYYKDLGKVTFINGRVADVQ